jgi:peptidyl-prolyl cis-trans isomerase C
VEINLKVAAGAFVLLALSGCERTATGQSVAVVNGEEVSRGELNAALQRANIGDGPQAERVRAQVLQSVIDRRLLTQKAIEDGIEQTPEFVVQERLAREQLLIDMLSRRVADSIPAPTPQQITQFIAQNPGMFAERSILALDQIQFTRPADPTILNQLRDDHSLEQVTATLNAIGIPRQNGTSRVDTANLPIEAFRRISGLAAGEPFIVPTPRGFVVSVIRSREPVQIAAADANRLAIEAWRRRQQREQLEGQLRQLRERASIEYQPGFGPAPANRQATNSAGSTR